MKIKKLLVLTLFIIPLLAFAAHTDLHRIESMRAEVASYKQEIAKLRLQAINGGRGRAIQLLEKEIADIEAKLADLEAKISEDKNLKLARGLQRGSSGNDVKKVQELLSKLPNVYPEGLATGFFGRLTEKAIRAFQQGHNLENVGMIGPKTREKLGQLSAAIGRKEKPRIDDISPATISVGTPVTISGSGFTFEGNHLFVRGKMALKNISSADGSSLNLAIPLDIPCSPDQACPIKIVNKNGISNAKPFKLVALQFPPEPEPPPPPPPPPPPTPEITSISPSFGQVGTSVTLIGSGFTAANNSINFGGLNNAITGLTSSDGQTLKFNVPSSPCKPLEGCSVSVTNANGTSNIVTFTLTQLVTPVVVSKPNGGEKFLQGSNNLISWTGGTDVVHVALVEATAAKGSDVTPLIAGWISSTSTLPNSSLNWSAKEVCDAAGAVCFPVAAGSYKILAASENEFGKVAIELDGSGNWDVSDSTFSVLPAPSINVLSPNGGEKWVRGSDATITWNSTSILSNAVAIKLLKAGNVLRTINSNFAQNADTGTFFYTWTVPTDLLTGSDYTVEVSDAANQAVRDVSDSAFTVALKSTITVVVPNGGETWFSGFKGLVRWNSGNILSKSVNINLLKGRTFYRRLATNVLQKFYSWQTEGYTSGTGFNTYVSIPADIPDGSDYAIEITDSADATVKDASDSAFTIKAVPSPVTLSGRLINKFTGAIFPNQYLYNHAYYGSNLPQWGGSAGKTDAEGRFSVATTTNEAFVLKIPVGAWPTCTANWWQFFYKYTENITWMNGLFDLLPDTRTVLAQSEINLGDVPMWPMTGLYFYSDGGVYSPGVSTLYSPGVSYADSGYWGWQILALEADLKVSIYEPAIGSYLFSPSIRIPLANGCTPKTLTYIGGVFKWEPYNVRTSYGLSYTYSVGQSVNVTFAASGGTSPYKWGLYYGPLPPGLSLDPATGKVTGTLTTAGTYKFQIKITDANGVNGGSWPTTVTVK